MNIIGVVGAGTMGRGVAQVFAEKGARVFLFDLSDNILNEAQKDIFNSCRLSYYMNRGKGAGLPEEVMQRIEYSTDLAELSKVEFLIENVTENLEIKCALYKKIDPLLGKDVIIAANTSCISITKLASYTSRPEKVIGIHFMNPVPMIQAVEVIKGYHTSDETIDLTIENLKQIGKESILVNDFPGFVSNRISHLMMNEAAFIVQDQVATVENVDAVFTKCYGHKMGPLETADLIGIDTVKDSLDVLFNCYQDPKYRCCPLIAKMVDAGLLGKKSGQGFYKYQF